VRGKLWHRNPRSQRAARYKAFSPAPASRAKRYVCWQIKANAQKADPIRKRLKYRSTQRPRGFFEGTYRSATNQGHSECISAKLAAACTLTWQGLFTFDLPNQRACVCGLAGELLGKSLSKKLAFAGAFPACLKDFQEADEGRYTC